MDNVLSALLGTIVGFFLGWIKEYMQNRPRLKIKLKTGNLNYIKQEATSYGDIIETKVPPEEANIFHLFLKFDVYNIGKVGTGVTDIFIKLSANNNKFYYQPEILLPIDKKKLDNISFNLEANTVYTVETELHITAEEPNSFVFNQISLLPEERNKLEIEVIVEALNKKKLSLFVEPISILTACN